MKKKISSRESMLISIMKRYDWENLRKDILNNLNGRTITIVCKDNGKGK